MPVSLCAFWFVYLIFYFLSFAVWTFKKKKKTTGFLFLDMLSGTEWSRTSTFSRLSFFSFSLTLLFITSERKRIVKLCSGGIDSHTLPLSQPSSSQSTSVCQECNRYFRFTGCQRMWFKHKTSDRLKSLSLHKAATCVRVCVCLYVCVWWRTSVSAPIFSCCCACGWSCKWPPTGGYICLPHL